MAKLRVGDLSFYAMCMLILAMGGIFFKSCAEYRVTTNQTFVGLEAVFYHEPGHYSFFVKKGAQLVPFDVRNAEVEIFADVEPGDQTWAYVYIGGRDLTEYQRVLKLHLHSAENLQGGGWGNGKFGEGTTHRIGP